MPFTADFETTTTPEDCRVWAYALCDISNPSRFEYGNSIDAFIERIAAKDDVYYFHNLRFDGEFILSWLLSHNFKFTPSRKDMEPMQFTTLISDSGQFYSIEIQFKKGYAKILDSLKILPFPVAKIAKAFDLPLSKLEIDYHETREPGHNLTQTEIDYIRNDVEIVARALSILFEQGLRKMTQASNALKDFKNTVSAKKFSYWFPTPEPHEDNFVRKSYRGGWSYCNPKYQGKIVDDGIVLDVNSLYPDRMYNMYLPCGTPEYYKGQYKPSESFPLYVQRINCAFDIKPGFLPTIQLKNNRAFMPNEYVTSSNGELIQMTLTSIDLELFQKHYDIHEIEYIDGYQYHASNSMFKPYIDKWMNVKIQATKDGNEGMRTLSKLMLNALYGKFGLNPSIRSKYPVLIEGVVKYRLLPEEQRKPLYIAVASFITAGARYKTISAAQANKDRFLYSDTDSLHLLGTEPPVGVEIDDAKLGFWKHESTFTKAKFLRQKTYIELINGDSHITCAGMPKSCYENVTFDNFIEGSVFPGKKLPYHAKGGIVLIDKDFTIRCLKSDDYKTERRVKSG